MEYFNPMAFMNYRMPRPRNLKLGHKAEATNIIQKPEEKISHEQAAIGAGNPNKEGLAVSEQPQ